MVILPSQKLKGDFIGGGTTKIIIIENYNFIYILKLKVPTMDIKINRL